MQTNALVAICLLFLVGFSAALLPTKNHVSSLHRPFHPDSWRNTKSSAPAQYYTKQVIDHFSPDPKGTFSQKYYVNSTNWKGDGSPVFLILGGEGPISASDVSTHFVISEYAVQFNALVISVEHRFYGETQPFNDTSVSSLKYLTTQQALADYAQFVEYIVEQYNCTNSPWISFGGSYSGSLSAWFRLKYPHLITGAIGSSAPVKAIEDFTGYLVTIGQDLDAECYNVVESATRQIESLLVSNPAKLDALFKTCRPIKNTPLDHALFMESITGGICGVCQYSNDNAPYQPFNVATMCDLLKNSSSDPLQSYANLVSTINKFFGSPCVPTHYSTFVRELQPTSSGRSWTWQTCTEYGYFQTGAAPNQPFSPLISLEFFNSLCADVFGKEYTHPNVDWINNYFGAEELAGSFIVLPNGAVDPWHSLGVAEPVNKLETALFMTDTAHCADLYPPSPNDPADLTATRVATVQAITKWLERFNKVHKPKN